MSDGQASLLADDGAQQTADDAGKAAATQAAAAAGGDEGVGKEDEPAHVDDAADANAWWKPLVTGLDKSEAMSFRNTASRYKEPKDYVKANLELRKSAIFVPKEDKPEAWNQVFDKLGRPKDPQAYEFDFEGLELDDTEKEASESFRGVAHQAGLLPRQVKILTQWQAKVTKTQRDAYSTRAKVVAEEQNKQIKNAWGADYPVKKSAVATAIKTNTTKDQFERIANARMADGTFVVDNPDFAEMFARIGMGLNEDGRDPTAYSTSGRENIQAEITRIENEALQKGYLPVGDPRYPHQQLNTLYEKLEGTKPLQIGMGARGR